jgi:predicted kinase
MTLNIASHGLVTGIMAAGKSTVSQALAERFDRSAHVRGDTFRRFIASGRAEMTADPSDDAVTQLHLRYELAATCADRYVSAGFTTVLQDIILGPMLTEVIQMIGTRPLAVVVLAPSPEEVVNREARRVKTGYTTFSPADMDVELRERTPRQGLWVDSTHLTVSETVDYILGHVGQALV